MYSDILRISKVLFLIIALGFIAYTIWHSRLAVSQAIYHCKVEYLVFAILFWSVGHLVAPLLVTMMLRMCSVDVQYKQNLRLHVQYLPAKYIPGGIWHTVGRVSGLHALGVRAKHLGSLIFFEHLLAAGVSLFVGGSLLLLMGEGRELRLLTIVGVVVAGMSLALGPVLLSRLFLKRPISNILQSYVIVFFLSIIFWAFASSSFYWYVASLGNTFSYPHFYRVIGAYLFSWGAGFLAFFAPQGIGIFEFFASKQMNLSGASGFSTSIALLSVFRFVVLFADLVVFSCYMMISFVVRRFKRI